MEKRNIEEASDLCGVPREIILWFIEEEWIHPIDIEAIYLDDEDVARIKLIWELHNEFEVNNEAMPIILNLIDQLNRIHLELKHYRIH
jgi:chaperone modulatory protein CbpM